MQSVAPDVEIGDEILDPVPLTHSRVPATIVEQHVNPAVLHHTDDDVAMCRVGRCGASIQRLVHTNTKPSQLPLRSSSINGMIDQENVASLHSGPKDAHLSAWHHARRNEVISRTLSPRELC